MKCGVWIGGRKGLVVRRQGMGVRREGYNEGGEPWRSKGVGGKRRVGWL